MRSSLNSYVFRSLYSAPVFCARAWAVQVRQSYRWTKGNHVGEKSWWKAPGISCARCRQDLNCLRCRFRCTAAAVLQSVHRAARGGHIHPENDLSRELAVLESTATELRERASVYPGCGVIAQKWTKNQKPKSSQGTDRPSVLFRAMFP